MPRTIIDAATVTAAGGTAQGTHTVPGRRRGHEWTYFIDGDANSNDLTVTFEVAPEEGGTYYPLSGTEEQNIDATGNLAFPKDIGAGQEVQVTVTNNGASDAVVSLYAEHSSK